ncbi:hypothetical protein MNR01_12835 [Lysobacter sp. S4-A87]|uniref:hypothetical protein n=1 Tax=Lysobacter sp. S4-A87 TaxID=2925843 RepID=UPI001F53696E|nr:hypothetical protein [Lysobacter sp. S4-A87]UNK48629.1 hypothetical protein MNR01_12835 [Lysobacter sp. S4-A87]
MKVVRYLAGWTCILLSFVLVVLLGFGAFELPFITPTGSTSMLPTLMGLLPSTTFSIALFAVGVWLLLKDSPR